MAASRLLILGVAAAAAGGAGYVAKQMTAPPPVVVSRNTPDKPAIALSQVLVLTENVPVGGVLDSQMRWQTWPTEAVDAGYITRDKDPDAMQKLKGEVVRIAMYNGEPLRRGKLVGEGKSLMSSILPSGMRAVATQISAETSAGGFILPDDYVDVIMTRRSQNAAGAEGFITETILQNIRVLAIDQTVQLDEDGKKTKLGATATLELTPQQAEIITVAAQLADRMTLALRSVKDTQEKVATEADYLVSSNGRRGTVRLIKSGEVSEVGARK